MGGIHRCRPRQRPRSHQRYTIHFTLNALRFEMAENQRGYEKWKRCFNTSDFTNFKRAKRAFPQNSCVARTECFFFWFAMTKKVFYGFSFFSKNLYTWFIAYSRGWEAVQHIKRNGFVTNNRRRLRSISDSNYRVIKTLEWHSNEHDAGSTVTVYRLFFTRFSVRPRFFRLLE